MKVLIAQTLFLGDLVLSTPLIDHLKNGLPEARIDLLVRQSNSNILKNNPAISEVLEYDRSSRHRGLLGFVRLVRDIRCRSYDAAIILPGSVRTAVAVFLAGIPRRIGSDRSTGMSLLEPMCKFPREARRGLSNQLLFILESIWKMWDQKRSFTSMFFTDIVPLDLRLHASERYSKLVSPIVPSSTQLIRIRTYPGPDEQERIDRLLNAQGEKLTLIAVAPGSKWATKRWPPEKYSQTIELLSNKMAGSSHRFVLIGGAEDGWICSAVLANTRPYLVDDYCGKLTPLESAELVRRCSVLITNDSAAMHIGSAVGTPCVAIFGPTVPAFGFTPHAVPHVLVEHKQLICRPCTPHGGGVCPLGTHQCMVDISPDEVVAAILLLLLP